MTDLRTDGVKVLRKGGVEGLYPLPRKVIRDLRRYANDSDGHGHSPTDRVFPISEWAVTLCLKGYAKRAGIEDWDRVSSHRLRAFFATDARDRGLDGFLIRDLMGHENIITTNTYTGKSTHAQLSRAMERLAN
jgi:integrase/recombinase XerD